jgi:hypothetical protein
MKKINLILLALLSSLFIFSCQKEKNGYDKSESSNEQSLKDAQLEKRILAFRAKIDLIRENQTLKAGTEPMEVDSAIWFIEAASNLTYGDASTELNGFVADSSFIVVTITNGQILWSDVQVTYDKIIDSLSSHNANITANEKQLMFADVSLKATNDNTAIFEVASGFGTDGTSGFGNDYPWYWGWELGRCDGTGLGVGQDAADKIAYLANMLISVPAGSSYYTDISYKWVNYWDVPTNSNPYGDYLLFHDFQETTLNHACLSTEEIGYYKNTLNTIGNMYKPSGKSTIRYFLWDDTAFGLCDPSDCWDMAHFAKVKYAIWHIGTPPSEL